MDRRRFLLTSLAGAIAAPLAAEAQQSVKARIGVLSVGANPRSASFYAAFEQRLRELGHIEGQSLIIDFRAPSSGEDLARVADALVRGRPDVLLVVGPEVSMKAARRATRTIPIVMVALNYDPISHGYVQGLVRPGGNITGLVSRAVEYAPKQLELLREALPANATVAVLWDARAAADQLRGLEAAAASLGVKLHEVEVGPPYDFDAAFATVARTRAAGVLLLGSPVFFRERARIEDLALKHRLPSMSPAYSDLRATLGFGPNLAEMLRRAADYVDKILKGAQPGDLPVEQPTKFELVINLTTAKALNFTIPPSLLLRADQVIE
jgi:putative tryptophan/tyrosine transport system substrate-binding protein